MPSSTLQSIFATRAYRTDATRGGARRLASGAEGEGREGSWIAVTNLLEHASLAERVEDGDPAPPLAAAIEIAREMLGDEVIRRRGDREWPNHRFPADAVLLLSDEAYEADALQTALAMITALDGADRSLSPVQRGRVLARRARILSRLGRMDGARDHFIAIDRLGRQAKSDELRARACLGLASIAQMRGNYPALETFGRRALRISRRAGLSFIERYSRLCLTVAAAARHDFDTALLHGWVVYHASVGQPNEEGEILQTFGQLMVEAKHFDEARAAFGAVVSRALPARIIVPALGGLAISAAETGHPATVRWVASQLRALKTAGVARYLLSLALLECSIALARVGQVVASDELRSEATTIAAEHGFHEVTIRAAELDRREQVDPGAAFALGGRALRIAGRIASMEPGRLPDTVSVVAVPA
jgi:tetratricopeptide (TPR) repeat protein